MNVKPYGISDLDREFAQMKIDKQIDYLKSNSILTSNGQIKSFLDMSMGANMSKRYYAEVTNRQNTNHSLAMDYQFKAVFITITLNGCWRDALKGNYSRFTAEDKKCLPSLIKMKIERGVSLTIRDLIAVLNYQWDSYSSRSVFRNIQKIYTRVFEPHEKDGVPHIHVLLYIPSNIIPKALEKFKEVFNAPQNLKNDQLSYEQQQNGEINGFQWTLNNPTGYVMKYIQKTFMDLRNENELSSLSAWYVKHKVRRFLTSRSTIPLWVYRKIFFMDKDLYNLSIMVKDPSCVVEWDFKSKYIRISDPLREKEVIYNNGDYSYTLAGREIIKKNKPKSYQLKEKLISKTLERNKQEKPIKFKSGYTDYHYYEIDGVLVERSIVPAYMKDSELINYYNSLRTKIVDLVHFRITQNECIKRGLIDGKIQSLNNFNTNITSEDYTMTKHDEVGILDTKTQPLPNIDKEYFGLPKSDIVLPKDFDYSFTKNEDEVIEKFPQSYFDFDTKIGV